MRPPNTVRLLGAAAAAACRTVPLLLLLLLLALMGGAVPEPRRQLVAIGGAIERRPRLAHPRVRRNPLLDAARHRSSARCGSVSVIVVMTHTLVIFFIRSLHDSRVQSALPWGKIAFAYLYRARGIPW